MSEESDLNEMVQAHALYVAADTIARDAGESTDDFIRWLTKEGGLTQMALAFFRAPASGVTEDAVRQHIVHIERAIAVLKPHTDAPVMSTPDGVAESLFRQMEEFGAGSGQVCGQRDDGTPTRLVYCALDDTAADALVVLKALDEYHANLPDGAEPGNLRVTITREEADETEHLARRAPGSCDGQRRREGVASDAG